jgi:hypothetical protein
VMRKKTQVIRRIGLFLKDAEATDRSLWAVSLVDLEKAEASFASPPCSSISTESASACLDVSISSSFFSGSSI